MDVERGVRYRCQADGDDWLLVTEVGDGEWEFQVTEGIHQATMVLGAEQCVGLARLLGGWDAEWTG